SSIRISISLAAVALPRAIEPNRAAHRTPRRRSSPSCARKTAMARSRSMAALMTEQNEDDTDGRRKIEPNHPSQEFQITFDLRKALIHGGEAVLISRNSLRGLARLVLRRTCREQGVVNLGDHRGHARNVGCERGQRNGDYT